MIAITDSEYIYVIKRDGRIFNIQGSVLRVISELERIRCIDKMDIKEVCAIVDLLYMKKDAHYEEGRFDVYTRVHTEYTDDRVCGIP